MCERNVTNGISSENGFLTVKQHAAGNMQQTAGKYSAPASDKVRLLMRQVHAHCTDLRTIRSVSANQLRWYWTSVNCGTARPADAHAQPCNAQSLRLD